MVPLTRYFHILVINYLGCFVRRSKLTAHMKIQHALKVNQPVHQVWMLKYNVIQKVLFDAGKPV